MNTEMKKLLDQIPAPKPIESEAYLHIGECTGMIEMLTRQPDFAIMVKVNDMEIGLCNTTKFVELLRAEINEAQKCIDKEPNLFQ
jgi:hypothetical protein